MNFAMRSAPSTGRVAAIALPPPSLTSVASALHRVAQTAAGAREDLSRVRLALADAPCDLVKIELEHLA
jgi:hypothetical protein